YARTLRTRKAAESFKRHVHSHLTSDRLFNRSAQWIDHLFIRLAEKLDRQMECRRLHPGDARASLQLRLNTLLQLMLESGKRGPKLLREFDGEERADHF